MTAFVFASIMETAEQHVSRLVANDAAALGIAPPVVRFVATNSGPCYEALFDRIEVDARTLLLPEPLLRLVIAHEVAHATQRRALLLDFAWTVLGVAALIAGPCVMFAAWPDEDLWRVSVPGAVFAFVVAMFFKAWRAHGARRAIALELDADAKAALICGARPALQALEEMTKRGIVDEIRLQAMRERCK
ncbi:hypothetical protein [Caballeronia concitans]|nr:hypothetical protein [Caballeronia concitans]